MEKLIFKIILAEKAPISNLEIAKQLNIPINSVTGRTFSLKNKGKIHIKTRRRDKYTGSLVQVYEPLSTLDTYGLPMEHVEL